MHMYLRVKLLGKDEVGWRAGDGDESTDGRGVGDAECQAFADHVVPLGGILGVSSGPHPLPVWDFNGSLEERERESGKNVVKWTDNVPDINRLLMERDGGRVFSSLFPATVQTHSCFINSP